MKALVVDDELNCREVVISYLKTFCPKIEVVDSADSVPDAITKINEQKPDIVLLDIRLGSQTAFDLLVQLEFINFQLIFTTAYDAYAVKAFEYSAVHYLLKPIDPTELVDAINRCCNKEIPFKKTTIDSAKNIYLNTASHSYNLSLKDILYILADGSYSTIYKLNGEKIFTSKNLGEYASLLSTDFFRIHHSTIVNLNHIVKIDKKNSLLVLINGEELIISKRKKSALRIVWEERK